MIKKKTTTKKKEIVRFDASMKPAIQALVKNIGGDGHTIWKDSILKDFPKAIKDRFVHTIESDGSYKGSIWNNGKMVKKLKGVYGLTLLGGICSDLNLTYDSKLGRGFQAQSYTEAIQEWLKKPIRKKRVISGISSGMEDSMYPSDDNSYCGIK